MKKLILLSALILPATFIFAQKTDVESQLAKNGEVYFKFEVASAKQIAELTGIISIDNVKGTTVFAYANANEFSAFESMGFEYKLLPHPNEGFNPTMATFEQIQNTDAWDFYPTYDAYVAMMQQFQTDYPALCDIDTIGQSVNSRLLLVARISDNVGLEEDEPEFFYTSTIHGDEVTGYVLMLRLIDSLLTGYGSDPRVTNLVDNIDIFINPLANPDGTYDGGNNTVAGATRYNANGYDLNRNFRDVVNGLHPNTQPETWHFMDFAESRHFVMSANFHGGAEVFNYPWDHKYDFCADDAWWQYVGHEYADTAQAHSPFNYMNGFDDGITNGAAWYSITGGRQDYMNFFQQCREVTIEISDTKTVPASQLPVFWEYNRRSFLNYMEQCLYGVRGIVTDAVSGSPLEAKVYVLNHEIDTDSSWVYSDLPVGNYHRQLAAGTYDIRFSAPCYEDLVINNVSIQNHATTVLDVQMVPTPVDFTANTTTANIGESVYFTDISCGNPLSWQWSFSGPGNVTYVSGTGPSSQDPIVQFSAAGQYDVSLTITSASGNFTIAKNNYITIIPCSYCAASASNPTEEWISNVTFNTINNTTGGVNGYEDYTNISTEVQKMETYNLSVSVGSIGTWTENVFAFIDWDQNCNFDVSETYDLGSTEGPGTLDMNITVPSSAQTGTTRMRIIERYSTDPVACGSFQYGEVEDYSINIPEPGFDLDLKVFLEGPFNGTTMNSTLLASPDFPMSQPYNTSPWIYPGTENVSSLPNPGIVDWILVEIRDATTADLANSGTIAGQRAAFLLNDGSVVDLDGVSPLHFDIQVNNQLFVVIHHRNHLEMMSAVALTEISGTYSYDFTDALSKAYQDGEIEIAAGIFGMAGGDINADGIVDYNDKDLNWDMDAAGSGYFQSDANMDIQVNNPDKTEVWYPNFGLEAKMPAEP